MMNDTINILVCENYLNEVETVLAEGGDFDGVTVTTFPSCCGRPPLSVEEMEHLLNAVEVETDVLGDSCLKCLRDAAAGVHRCRLHITTPCFGMFADHREIERALRKGAYLLTPGWLSNWQDRIATWGFAQEELRTFLHEATKSLLLLDTGVDSESAAHLQAFAAFVDLPYRIFAVGLDFFSQFLRILVLKRRLEQQKIKAEKTAAKLRQQASDYAMALDLLGRFSITQDEEETIGLILEIFDMLLAPHELSYVCFEEGRPVRAHSLRSEAAPPDEATMQRIAAFHGNHAWNDPGGGLFRIAFKEETVGMVLVGRITFPEYRQHYLDLALTILLPICALSINNARNYEQLKRSEQELLNLNQELEQRVKERTAELEKNNRQLTQMNRFLVNRELRMIDLKEKIRELESASEEKNS